MSVVYIVGVRHRNFCSVALPEEQACSTSGCLGCILGKLFFFTRPTCLAAVNETEEFLEIVHAKCRGGGHGEMTSPGVLTSH